LEDKNDTLFTANFLGFIFLVFSIYTFFSSHYQLGGVFAALSLCILGLILFAGAHKWEKTLTETKPTA
jgi:multisubunit Na+/H+ antiporter MnhB subunit